MIKIKDVDIAYGKTKIFTNLDLDFKTHKITGIIAPSGSGKTTLINAITGLKAVDKGLIYLDNINIKDTDILQNISIMPQEAGLYLNLTGKQNFNFFAKLKGLKYKDIEIERQFIEFGLDNALNRKVSAYSGGMKRKLSLMITLIGDASFLFLDEPTVGIDPIYKELIWQKLQELKGNNKTIIVTTHIMDEARKCDEIIILDHGEILIQDTYDNILNHTNCTDLEQAVIKLIRSNNE